MKSSKALSLQIAGGLFVAVTIVCLGLLMHAGKTAPHASTQHGLNDMNTQMENQIAATQVVAEQVAGMKEADAVAYITKQGKSSRVVSRDGQSFIVTADYRTDRIDLVIVKGNVSSSYVG